MSDMERSWTIWQAPVLLLRNWHSVPGIVRNSAYVTFMFEISGLVSAPFWEHCSFSCYSMTLALGNHPIVDGWDADVIAEDHHMYMKCMFASYWEDIFATRTVSKTSKLQLQPVWLPVTSYMVEDSRGWQYSVWARFQQARRHAQGIAELSYCMLQYWSILNEIEGKMPLRSHIRILGLAFKYMTVHIINTWQGFLMLCMGLVGVYWSIKNYMNGQLADKMGELADLEMDYASPVQMAVLALMNFMPPLGIFYITTWMTVLIPSLEGRFCPLSNQLVEKKSEKEVAQNNHAGSDREALKPGQKRMNWVEWLTVLKELFCDCYVVGAAALFMYGSIPCFLAVTSLSLYGHQFDYIVAAKPEGGPAIVENDDDSQNMNDDSQNAGKAKKKGSDLYRSVSTTEGTELEMVIGNQLQQV